MVLFPAHFRFSLVATLVIVCSRMHRVEAFGAAAVFSSSLSNGGQVQHVRWTTGLRTKRRFSAAQIVTFGQHNNEAPPHQTLTATTAPSDFTPVDQNGVPPLPSAIVSPRQGINLNQGGDELEYLRLRFQSLAKSATLNAQRTTHASLGAVSLVIGLYHATSLLSSGWSTVSYSQFGVVWVGLLHCAASAAGVARLDFRNKSEEARTAMFWPLLPTNIWLLYTLLTEWGMGANAPFTMYDDSVRLFGVVNIAIAFWQLGQAWKAASDEKQQKTGLWFQSPLQNTLATFLSYQIVTLSTFGLQLLASIVVDAPTYNTFMATYPEFSHLQANIQLDMAFANNFVAFLVTLHKYKAVDKNKIFAGTIVFNMVLAFGYILPAAFSIDDGMAMKEWVDLVLKFNS